MNKQQRKEKYDQVRASLSPITDAKNYALNKMIKTGQKMGKARYLMLAGIFLFLFLYHFFFHLFVQFRMREKMIRAVALAMAGIIIVTSTGVASMAAADGIFQNMDGNVTVTGIDDLDDSVKNQSLPVGAEESAIEFPATLSVDVIQNSDTDQSGAFHELDDIMNELQEIADSQDAEETTEEEVTPTEEITNSVDDAEISPVESDTATDPVVIEEDTEVTDDVEKEHIVAPEETNEEDPQAKANIGNRILDALFPAMTAQAAELTEDAENEENEASDPEVIHTNLPVTWTLNAEKSSSDVFDSTSVGNVFVYQADLIGNYGLQDVMIPEITVTIVDSLETTAGFKESVTIDDVVVTVLADEGVFPDDATLSVEKVSTATEELVANNVDSVREADTNVVESYTFDIKVFNAEGVEIQPDTTRGQVHVSFATEKVSNENLNVDIYHSDDVTLATDKLDTNVEIVEGEQAAVAATTGFSFYTVEFTYNNLQYVLAGDESVKLATVLESVGLTGAATNAVSSNPSLFATSVNAENEWIVTAKQAFNTKESLTVTIDDVDYVIDVTDSQITASHIAYGQNMDESTITLITDTDNATSYQWQVSDSRNGTYTNLTASGATTNSFTFTPENEKWYRCVINGTEGTKPLQAVKEDESSVPFVACENSDYWYLGNGVAVYWSQSSSFNVCGVAEISGKKLYLSSSYDNNSSLYGGWRLLGKASSTTSYSENIDKTLLYFDDTNEKLVNVVAYPTSSQTDVALNCDTALGNVDYTGKMQGTDYGIVYGDKAAINAIMDGTATKQIQIVDAASTSAATNTTPSMLFVPVTPLHSYKVGYYGELAYYDTNESWDLMAIRLQNGYLKASDRISSKFYSGKEEKTSNYSFSTINGESIVTGFSGSDSVIWTYWTGVSASNPVRFQFGLGNASDFSVVTGDNPSGNSHTHTWTYETTGTDTAIAYCSQSENSNLCSFYGKENALTLSIAAQNATYTGLAYTGASISDGISDEYPSAPISEITYEGIDGTTYSASTTAPIAAGSYKASVTVGTVTVYDTFTIGKAALNVTAPTANTLIYNGAGQALVTAGSAVGGAMQYSIDGGITWGTSIPEGTDVGTYPVYYKVVSADGNHTDTETLGPVNVIIAPKNITGATVTLGNALEANGQEQTQTVSSVVIDGLTATYTTANDSATDAGAYSMQITGTGNFTGTINHPFVILGATAADSGTVDLGNGKINVAVNIDDSAPVTEVKTTKTELLNSVATADDLAAVAGGKTLDIWIEVKDASDSITETAKDEISAATVGYTVGRYIDISLYKKWSTDSDSTKLTGTNSPVEIQITIPADIWSSNYQYDVVRDHEGEVTFLNATQNGQTLTFTTDKFSDYAIVYKAKPSGNNNSSRGGGSSSDSDGNSNENSPSESTPSSSPKTPGSSIIETTVTDPETGITTTTQTDPTTGTVTTIVTDPSTGLTTTTTAVKDPATGTITATTTDPVTGVITTAVATTDPTTGLTTTTVSTLDPTTGAVTTTVTDPLTGIVTTTSTDPTTGAVTISAKDPVTGAVVTTVTDPVTGESTTTVTSPSPFTGETPIGHTIKDTIGNVASAASHGSPKTGDDFDVYLWWTILLFSVLGLSSTAYYYKSLQKK